MPPGPRHAEGPLGQATRRIDDFWGRPAEAEQRDDPSVMAAGVVCIRGERASRALV